MLQVFLFCELKVDHTTKYVSLIDCLIHTKDDVELLVKDELGSHKELTSLINNLCKYVVANSSCYYQLVEDFNDHCNENGYWYIKMGLQPCSLEG